jgi:hypothetical protein
MLGGSGRRRPPGTARSGLLDDLVNSAALEVAAGAGLGPASTARPGTALNQLARKAFASRNGTGVTAVLRLGEGCSTGLKPGLRDPEGFRYPIKPAGFSAFGLV